MNTSNGGEYLRMAVERERSWPSVDIAVNDLLPTAPRSFARGVVVRRAEDRARRSSADVRSAVRCSIRETSGKSFVRTRVRLSLRKAKSHPRRAAWHAIASRTQATQGSPVTIRASGGIDHSLDRPAARERFSCDAQNAIATTWQMFSTSRSSNSVRGPAEYVCSVERTQIAGRVTVPLDGRAARRSTATAT